MNGTAERGLVVPGIRYKNSQASKDLRPSVCGKSKYQVSDKRRRNRVLDNVVDRIL